MSDTPVAVQEVDAFRVDQVAAYAGTWLRALDLNENQAVFSMLGLDPIIQPRMADGAGRGRLINTGRLETSALLANYAINYIPNRMKLRPPDLSDTQWNMALHLMNEAAGGMAPGTSKLNNVTASFGIDLATQGGLGELELALADKPSAFDKINCEIADDQYHGILRYVRTIAVGNATTTKRVVGDQWRDEATEMLFSIVGFRQNLEEAVTALRALKGNLSSDPRSLVMQVSSASEVAEAMLASYTEVFEKYEGLRYLATSAYSVNHGSSLLSLDRLDASLSKGTERAAWYQSEIYQSTGALIRLASEGGVGASLAIGSSLDNLDRILSAMGGEVTSWAEEASRLFLTVLREVAGVVEETDEVPVNAPLQRPNWRP